jgi:predicted dehydrogenase
MKALVVGYGSIGQRHERLLRHLGLETAIVSKRTHAGRRDAYSDLASAVSDWNPDYVVIANATADHRESLDILATGRFAGTVLIEKPLFGSPADLPAHHFARCAVAYNFRFHPLLTRLKALLAAESAVTAQVHVGQHLSQWRSTDYRTSYSASRQAGGGALRDLSHEIDYALWLFGPWQKLTAMGGHFSELEIDSDDSYSLLLETAYCPSLSIHVNYLDRIPRRDVHINTRSHTLKLDLIAGRLDVDGETIETCAMERDATYLAQHKAMLAGDATRTCSLEQGLEVLTVIEAAERASNQRVWICR